MTTDDHMTTDDLMTYAIYGLFCVSLIDQKTYQSTSGHFLNVSIDLVMWAAYSG